MTKDQVDNYKKNMEKMRMEEAKIREAQDTLQRQQGELVPSERRLQLDGEQDSIQIYEDWLKLYKKNNPGFKEDENRFHIDKNGDGCICFKDPDAEEDFVRNLASNHSTGSILDKGITIATFQDGKLIDPRTNQEFPEGGYSELVQKLDSGIAYSDISSPQSTAPTPFARTSY